MFEQMKATITELRQQKPIVLCLTNYVTMDFIANSLLALGAAPLMSTCDDELEELIKVAHAISINLGTLDNAFIKRCHQATEFAKQYHKPLVLDPTGAGASRLRTKSARKLIEKTNIIRGNASEIMSLIDDATSTGGVESLHPTDQAKATAHYLAFKYNSTVVVSGEEDFITNGKQSTSQAFGSSLMRLVTGMGCSLTAVLAAFNAILPDTFEASLLATGYFGLCGNLAHLKATTPAAFRTAFIDELYLADTSAMERFYVE